jgi:hypothetical protein
MRTTRLPMTLTVAAAAIAVTVGVSSCGSGASSTTSSTTTHAGTPPAGGGNAGSKPIGGGGPGAPPKTQSKHPGPRPQHHGPPGRKMQHTYAAEIVGHGASEGPIQPAELWPVTNSWRVSDHKTFTAVYAGANPSDHDTGRLVVFRQDYVHVKQTAHDVDVKGSGPVTITNAPTGHDVGTSAQQNGEIQFRGANGTTGTLHLSNDTVSVSSG